MSSGANQRQNDQESLFGLLECGSDCFHALAVDSQIAVACPRRRAEVNLPGVRVEQEFDVVDEAEKGAAELDMQVIPGLADDGGTRH